MKIALRFILASLFAGLMFNGMAQTPGTIDLTFNPGDHGFGTRYGADDEVKAMALQTNGKIILGGAFIFYNGDSVNRVVRVNTDGSVDTTFKTGSGFDSQVLAVAVQTDGKILLGGYFTSYNGHACSQICRLNTDGSFDNTFNPGTGANGSILAMDLQPDGGRD